MLNHIKRFLSGGMVNWLELPLYLFAIPLVLLIRFISPWFLVRFGELESPRIGGLAAIPELYLCEQDAGINVPSLPYIDVFYMPEPICNQQLSLMIKRTLRIWPAWLCKPVHRLSKFFFTTSIHEVGTNTMFDQDVYGLLDVYPPHIKFTDEEIIRGEAGLRAMGIPSGASIVCITARDSAYLSSHLPQRNYSYHSYRDSNIQNYALAADELAKRGYYVLRMGAIVCSEMPTTDIKVIDYACNGMRSDFMDIYLGFKCALCISSGTGWDAIPLIFRKPIAYVNLMPLGYHLTYRKTPLAITKHHYLSSEDRNLCLSEIFDRGLGFADATSTYEKKGVELIENSAQEIRDLAVEMVERLEGVWQESDRDLYLQSRFWEIFPTGIVNSYAGQFQGGIRQSRFGAAFLRNNSDWLQ